MADLERIRGLEERLVNAWPARWSGPAFNALSGEIAIEELEVAFEDLVWLEQTTTEGG